MVGQALLNTLKAALKNKWTKDLQVVWERVYEIVSTTMIGNLYGNQDILTDEITQHKVNLIQTSWRTVMQLGPTQVGMVLFKNLFEISP